MEQPFARSDKAVASFDMDTCRDFSEQAATLASGGIIGRLVKHSAHKGSIRDKVQSTFNPPEHLHSLLLLGRGLFIMIFTFVEGAHSLAVSCSLPIQDRILFCIPWYPDFEISSFDERHQIPRFPVKLSFSELPAQFRVASILQGFGSIFGLLFSSSIDVGSSVLSIKVAISPA